MTDQPLWVPWTGDGVTLHLPGPERRAACSDPAHQGGPFVTTDAPAPLAQYHESSPVCSNCVRILGRRILDAAEARVRELHAAVPWAGWPGFGCWHTARHDRQCGHCHTCWPCPTLVALDGDTPTEQP